MATPRRERVASRGSRRHPDLLCKQLPRLFRFHMIAWRHTSDASCDASGRVSGPSYARVAVG